MHVNADWALLEVVDENNEPVPDGETGAKVLVTNLANYTQPIIRYEIGDMITMATEPCGCGSNLPLIDHVEGRDSDVFEIKTDKGTQVTSADDLRTRSWSHAGRARVSIDSGRKHTVSASWSNRCRAKRSTTRKTEKVMHEQLREYGLHEQLTIKVETVERLTNDGEQKFKRV